MLQPPCLLRLEGPEILIIGALQKKPVASARASDQKAVDKALLSHIKNEPHLLEYLRSSFSLRKGDRPHEMKW